MRNLKKILALVLALVMSLSLMATASATDFKDDANVGETYRVAVDVLSDLSVFGGDQNGNFNPQDPIRRSEVAAIIYRIATGDTGSEGHKSYTPYNQFADVVDGSWYAGYVTYCANAGYIKGRNDGNFHPNDNVTGYEVLAMILRAVGYDKNNEFVGSNWQTNTASIATQRGVLKNLTGTTLLSQPATREVVAELLFRSIMLQQVTWNANSLSYSDNGATLAKQNLNMEAVTGVVMGNERGNLEGGSVLAEGKTSLRVNGETSSRTLNVSTDLTVIGESRSAYIQGSKVLGGLLEDAGNDVKDNEGAETTVEKLRGGLNVKDAQHFVNFADEDQDSSEWLIRYVVENSSALSSAWVEYFDGLSHDVKDKHHVVKLNAAGAIVDYSSTEFAAYEVSIQPDTRILATDKAIMKAIFSTANRTEANPSEKPVNGYVYGEVYVGTSSLEDKSDIMSWNKFVETYLVTGKVKPINEVGNGNWLKIIDNNGDGKAEYVLHTIYTLDEVADSATRNGATTYFYNGIDSTAYDFIYLNDYAPAVGDIVLYAVIDGTIQIHKADTAKATFKAVNYKERQATDVNGDVKEQSDIDNYTRLPEILTSVNENVEYDLYLDDYGYVRAYNNKTSYALVTEVYNTNRLNQGWVTGRALTAEVALAGENAIREYPVLNSSYYNNGQGWNPFYIGDNLGWHPIQNPVELNYLKPATHMLDTDKQGNEFIFNDNTFPAGDDGRTWTNVAEYIMGENGINLYTAAKDGNETYNSSRTDYIQLDIRNTSAADPLYVIDDVNYPKDTGDANAQSNYVRAVDNTQFFAVDQYGNVRQWVGYRNTLGLKAVENGIHAMYAVATNTNSNREGYPYWVANVIVIEVEKFDDQFESISLIYSNNTKISGDVKYLQALDNAKGEIGIIPNNVNIWNGRFTDYGFYGLSNIKVYDEENKLYTADITRIHADNGTNHQNGLACGEDYGIYFGRVRSRLDENYYSDYITADILDNKGLVVKESVTLSLADFGGAYSITKGNKNYQNNYYNDANWMTLGGHASNRVNEGDYILWAEAKGNTTNKVGFIVDISDKTVRSDRSWENADFIGTVAAGIANEQTTTVVDPIEAAKTAAVKVLTDAADAAKKDLNPEDEADKAIIDAINAALEAALTKVNEATTVEAVETAKTEGLKAIEEAKGDVPASEFALTLTIGENVTKVTVTVTEEGKEPVSTDYTETPAEAIKVPAGAKVEFVAEYAEGYEALKSAAPIEKMEADQTAEFTAKKIGEVIYTLTVKTDEHVEKVVVTITNGEGVTTEEVTTREQNVSVPENAAVSFEATYAQGYKAGNIVENIDAMTQDDEVSFSSIVDSSDKATFALNTENPTAAKWYWGPKYDDPNKVKTDIEIKAVEGYEVGAEIAIADFVNMPELPSQEDENGVAATDWDIVFAPADAAHYDYEKNVVVVDKIGEILVSVMCYNPAWTQDQNPGNPGGDGGDGEPWNPDFGGTTNPSENTSRMRMASPGAVRARVPVDENGNVTLYVGYLPAHQVFSKIEVNGVQIDTALAKVVDDTDEKGNVWSFPAKFAGNYEIRLWVKDKDNAPEITTKVIDETGAVVPAAEYTLTETHEAFQVLGKVSYDYTWTLTIKDSTKYTTAGGNSFEYSDKTASPQPGRMTDAGENTYRFTLMGVEKAGELTVKLKAADAISVTLSDGVTLTIDKDKFLKGSDRKGETITVAVADAYKDEYGLPVVLGLYTVGGGYLTPGSDYTYNSETGVITFLKGEFDIDIEIRGTAVATNGVQVTPDSTNTSGIAVSPKTVARTEFTKLPVIQVVPAAGQAYPTTVTVAMKDGLGNLGALTVDEDFTYDAATGQITFIGSKSVTGDIEVTAATAAAIKGLTVVVSDGVLEVSGTGFTPANAQYMVINEEESPSLYKDEKIVKIVSSLLMAPATTLYDDVCSENKLVFSATKPTLTSANNGDYIVVIQTDDAVASIDGETVVKMIGIVKVSGVEEGGSTGPATVKVVTEGFIATADEALKNITITAKDASYLVPTTVAGYTITVGGKVITATSDSSSEYWVEAGENNSAIVHLTTTKTGNIVITVNSSDLVAPLTVTNDTEGDMKVFKGKDPVATLTNYYAMALDAYAVDSVKAVMNTVTADKSLSKFLEAIGQNGTYNGTEITTSTSAVVKAAGTAAGLPASSAAAYLLVVEVESVGSKVVSAGICENNKLAPIPTLDASGNNSIFTKDIKGSLGTAKRTPYDTLMSGNATEVTGVDIAQSGGLVLTATTADPISTVEALYVPNWTGYNPTSTTTWADMKAASGVITLSTADMANKNSLTAALKTGSKDENVKNGTLWIEVTSGADANLHGYYAVPITLKDSQADAELNLEKLETGYSYVFLEVGNGSDNDDAEVESVRLIGTDGVKYLNFNTVGAYVYAVVAQDTSLGKVEVTVKADKTDATDGIALAVKTNPASTSGIWDKTGTAAEEVPGTQVQIVTFAQNADNNNNGAPLAKTYEYLTITLS